MPIEFTHFDWVTSDCYPQHSNTMPDNRFAALKFFDAIHFGAVGWPDKVPDHILLWGPLLKFRREIDQ